MRHQPRATLSAALAAALLAGCGGGGSDGPVTSRILACDLPGDSCETLTVSVNDAQQAALEASCGRSGGTFAVGACATAGKLAGTCLYQGAAARALGLNFPDASLVVLYDAAAWTDLTAEAYCTSATVADPPGTWRP